MRLFKIKNKENPLTYPVDINFVTKNFSRKRKYLFAIWTAQ